MSDIAIVGMACRYADARSPAELWENVLAQRRSFRRIPRVRLDLAAYGAEEQGADRISVTQAAVLEDYEFDRIRFHVSQEAYDATDLTHWLALDVAAQALQDARLTDAGPERRERTGVYIGNSLTGEFARARLLRLRWPYVRRTLAEALRKNSGFPSAELDRTIAEVEALYKAPFPPSSEESLAGGLANTIAGRICNYFDFKGGGYTVDGACASSLLAVTTACSALQSGDVDIAIAGGVDLSLDPFELAGFSRLGALAAESMRVFDADSAGFWPGEGCGMVVLMRHEDALARLHAPRALVRGWGISSDGHGGITRPQPEGQFLALRRAYERAGYGIDSVAYFEGHGTGTAVGDAAELRALNLARSRGSPAAIGSVKANIGHTKAAAGVAGLIKTALALQARVLPPTTGCQSPHPELTSEETSLRVLREGEMWPAGAALRAGVSAFGFGGINAHVTLEADGDARRRAFTGTELRQMAAPQDAEVFLFAAATARELASRIAFTLEFAEEASLAELTDLAAHLSAGIETAPDRTGSAAETRNGGDRPTVRAACVASTSAELVERLQALLECCESGARRIDGRRGIYFRRAGDGVRARIGFLFPGQASPVYTEGGIWRRRFASVAALYERAGLPRTPSVATEIAQPCIVTASLAGLRVLRMLGIEACVAVGHSLGELTALHWAEACTEEQLSHLARERGRVMSEAAEAGGAMASIGADRDEVQRQIEGERIVVAAHNSLRQTVISGEEKAVRRLVARMSAQGTAATLLPVSHAFHSPLVARVAVEFEKLLAAQSFSPPARRVVSTITATPLDSGACLRSLLADQITSPVEFDAALRLACAEADLMIEVGPGDVLSAIAAETTGKPCIALDSGGPSLRGLCHAIGAAFVLGAEVRVQELSASRFVRPLDPRKKRAFLQSPCEIGAGEEPVQTSPRISAPPAMAPAAFPALAAATSRSLPASHSAQDTLRNLVAERTQLPLAVIRAEQRFLDDLHLNSITISQIVLQAAEQLNVAAPVSPREYTNATIAEAAATLEALPARSSASSPSHREDGHPAGVESWIRTLAVDLVETELKPQPRSRRPGPAPGRWEVVALQDADAGRDTFLVECIGDAFHSAAGEGLVCCVPGERDQRAAEFLLHSVQSALRRKLSHVVFVQHEGGASALARALFLENPAIGVTVVNVPGGHPRTGEWVRAEAGSHHGFLEVHYDPAGVRREPKLRVLWPEGEYDAAALPGPGDLLLVTGGGSGIAAECALQLALAWGCRLALVGRRTPADSALSAHLERIAALGVTFAYFSADVADAAAVQEVLARIRAEMGPVTAVLHGAGINLPKRLPEITDSDLRQTLAPKLNGLRNVLAALNDGEDQDHLRLLVTFGSIIARSGLHGEAHYGLANEWLNLEVEQYQRSHPRLRCLNLEWSVWAGVGMGENLGVLDSLVRQGITPLPVDDAIAQLRALLVWKQAPVSAIVTGRFGHLPTLSFPAAGLPLRRFLERVRVHYPGIELIADCDLSAETDLYLKEHVIQGEQLLPAVMGMEAMAQAAMALEETDLLPDFRGLRFEHPISVPPGGSVTLRVAALRSAPGIVTAVVRCSSTEFLVDHFSGECIFKMTEPAGFSAEAGAAAGAGAVTLDPARDVYGRILFHQGRFRRVIAYRCLQAERSVAVLRPPDPAPWFARYYSQALAAGDPASRDAALHSIQACIPHKTVLPVGIDRVMTGSAWTREAAVVHALERRRDGDSFLYDVRIEDTEGNLCEQWEGLRLRAVAPLSSESAWPPALLVPYMERKLAETFPGCGIHVRMVNDADTRCAGAIGDAVREICGGEARLVHRPDGKPGIAGHAGRHAHVSLSYCGPLTLIVFSDREMGCDLEEIGARAPEIWEKLLGLEGFALARRLAETEDIPPERAAAQIWTLQESLRKSGACATPAVTLHTPSTGGWSSFSAGAFTAATFHARLGDSGQEIACGFAVRKT